MKLDNYAKINEWFDSSIGQSSVIYSTIKCKKTHIIQPRPNEK